MKITFKKGLLAAIAALSALRVQTKECGYCN